MKKLLVLTVAAAMLFGAAGYAPVGAQAEEGYTVECTEEENLAVNPYNWLMPTLNSSEFTVDGTNGMKFNNFIKDQQCVTYFRGGNFGEFKLSLLVNANLSVPAEGKAQWRYSEAYITFLIDRDPEDAVAEDGKPWYANKVYGSFCFGLTSGGTPISRFMYYNAFASNCQMSGQNYQPGGYRDVNVVDGKDHWIEITVRNYDENGVTGKRWTATIDGETVAEFDRDDDVYYDADTKREYEVAYSGLKGGIGIYTNSDWPSGYSPSKMNNFLEIKKAKMISYDENPEGETVGQCSAPVFRISAKDFGVAPYYEAGDPVEIQLSDLFEYGGTDEVKYEITCDGQPLGEIVNGFWTWTPTKEGSYDVDFKATVSGDNEAVNYLTLRVQGNLPSESTPESVPGDTGTKKGCGGSVDGGLFFLGVAAVFALKKRKHEEI